MPSQVRDRMIGGALDLLARRGLQATSFAEVTQATQTPRGSIYHHFPGGKQELVLATLDLQAELWREAIATIDHSSPEGFVSDLLARVRESYEANHYEAGTAVGAVIIGAENPEQLEHCADAFEAFIGACEKQLLAAGVEPTAARDFASLLLQTLAGGTLLARATRTSENFEIAAQALTERAARLPRASEAAAS